MEILIEPIEVNLNNLNSACDPKCNAKCWENCRRDCGIDFCRNF